MHTTLAELYLNHLVSSGNTPSIQYLFFDQDKILYRFSAGQSNILENKSPTPETIYHLYSTTKTFTALAILQLVHGRQLELDQPVIRYLPGFPYGPVITVRQLLNHTAGLPNPIPLNWIHLAEEHAGFDEHAFFKNIFSKHRKVKTAPNTRFAYSNLGYVLLGQLIEALTGRTYPAYISEHILHPLGLGSRDLGFDLVDLPAHATGYHKHHSITNWVLGLMLDKKKYMGQAEQGWQPFHPMYLNGTAYGGLFGTPTGLVRYLQELLRPDGTLIPEHYKQIMLTENHTVHGKPTGMCLSWFTDSISGHRYYTHAGGGGGYYVEMRLYPKDGKGSVLFFNRTGMTDERLLDKVDIHML